MKIRNVLFLGVFSIAFVIGCALVFSPDRKTSASLEPSATVNLNLLQTSEPEAAKTNLPEIIEDVDNWIDEERYPFKIRLLKTGVGYHGDEIEAKNGETWLGLFKQNDEYVLRSSKIKIQRVYDDIVDYPNKNRKTGKNVDVEGSAKPIFLLKDAKNLRVGAITTLFQGKTWEDVRQGEESDIAPDHIMTTLRKGFVQRYEIGGKNYELKVVEAKNNKNDDILALTLESDGKRQILHTTNAEYEDNLGTLYWVGDLDSDGKPDFYMDLFVHYNIGNLNLFLSSEAKKGKLIEKVANFWTSGC